MRAVAGRLRGVLGWLWAIVALIVAALIAEVVPLFKAPDALYARQPGAKELLLGLTIALAVVGLLLLVGAQFVVRRPRPDELTEEAVGEGVQAEFGSLRHDEVEGSMARTHLRDGIQPFWWRGRYRFRGRSVGQGFAVEAPLSAMKAAWRAGAWRTQPVWQLAYLMALGALLLTLGLFGIWLVLGPPLVRVIALAALVYAGVRTVRAVQQA